MQFSRNEADVMANWDGDHDQPLVSVCCVTYNHEKYIENALKGFLIQETTFPFEIIVYDDASTDGTVEIIKKIVSKYPNIVKPVLQLKNQYSICSSNPAIIALANCKGKYIAWCEGDDYWISQDKLEMQAEVLKTHVDVSMVFSSAIQKQAGKKDWIRNKYDKTGIIDITMEWVLKKGGGFYPTASVMFRSNILIDPPKWLWLHTTADYPLALLCRTHGKFFYLDEPLIVYNCHENSVSHAKHSQSIETLNQAIKKRSIELSFLKSLQIHGIVNSDKLQKELMNQIEYSFCRLLASNGILLLTESFSHLRQIQKIKAILLYFKSFLKK